MITFHSLFLSHSFSYAGEKKIDQQGIHQKRYTIVPRTLIFIRRGSQVLLLRGAPHKRLWANLYNGIGGHVERGEDILSSAKRELLEETGLTEVDLWLCGTVIIDVIEDRGIGIYVFYGDYKTGTIKDSDEGELHWCEISKINELPLVEDLTVLLPKVIRMKRGYVPFSARYRYDDQGSLQIDFAS